jgi:aspartyl-tRNA(Asn)/glutamyl-tRNA(Gln) amidotransferase subunit B
MGEVSRRLNQEGCAIENAPVKPDALGWLISRINDGTISNNNGKVAFDQLWKGSNVEVASLSVPSLILHATGTVGERVDALIERLGLKQMNDSGVLEKIVGDVLAANPKNVEQYQAGNAKALNALVGQIMKGSQGKANPQQVTELLRSKLG